MQEQESRPIEMFKLWENMFLAQQQFMPSGDMAEKVMRAARTLMEAQLAYTQTWMGANAAMFSGWAERSAHRLEEDRPSVACRQNEVMTG
jgi:hypothetical protein